MFKCVNLTCPNYRRRYISRMRASGGKSDELSEGHVREAFRPSNVAYGALGPGIDVTDALG